MKRKPEFQEEALKLYGVMLKPGEKRKLELIMRETYLDFYSKSLQQARQQVWGGVLEETATRTKATQLRVRKNVEV